MSIYVLAMKNSVRRLRFKSFPVDYEFFDAITNNSSGLFDINGANKRYSRSLLDGEIGCALSHYSLCKHLAGLNEDWSVILEDDAIIDNDNRLVKLISSTEIVARPTIIILGQSKVKKTNIRVLKLRQPSYEKFEMLGESVCIRDVNYFGTVGYMINKPAAILISNHQPIVRLADDWNAISSLGVDIFHLEDPLVYEDLDEESTIGNHIRDYYSLKDYFVTNIFNIIKAQISFSINMIKKSFVNK